MCHINRVDSLTKMHDRVKLIGFTGGERDRE